jgi:putative serine protease PepD
MTNNHVVEAAVLAKTKITVKLANNTQYTATLVGRDISYDLAILKIDVSGAPALVLGDKAIRSSSRRPCNCHWFPFAWREQLPSGIISAKNRPVTTSSESTAGESSFIDALQTDAAINPGNLAAP